MFDIFADEIDYLLHLQLGNATAVDIGEVYHGAAQQACLPFYGLTVFYKRSNSLGLHSDHRFAGVSAGRTGLAALSGSTLHVSSWL